MRAAVFLCILAVAGHSNAAPASPASSSASAASSPATPASTSASEPVNITTNPPITISLVQNATSPESHQAKAAEGHEHWYESPDWWVAGMTFLLALVTWRLVVKTRDLVNETRATSERQERETREALRIAQDAAGAARDGVIGSKQTSEMQLRAYVNVIDVAAKWKDEPDDITIKRIVVEVNFKNTGQTPAQQVSSWMIVKSMSPQSPTFETDGIERTIDSLGVQGPGAINHLQQWPQIENFSRGVVRAWKDGIESLFVFGEIKYMDAFGMRRRSTFRFVMPPAGVESDSGKFQACREGNEST